MDKETAHHLHELVSILHQYKEGIFLLFAALSSMAIFWLRNSFVTRQSLKEFDKKNEQTHCQIVKTVDELDDKVDHISENVAWMRGKMESLHPDD